ncbi:uncharacterized protein LOC110446246 isoform X2 [Mizuhopecten yessoensis]|nr:uncharacterized protein LOC110446246 isoform X2 [Mizuhopecten yessoensis]
MFHDLGYTASKMASLFECSKSLIYKRLHSEGIYQSRRYANIENTEIDAEVSKIHKRHPNAGSQMMAGYLEGKGICVQRRRVRESLSRIDPSGERMSRSIARRQYRVSGPNSLWHIDGHMKLIRWGIVTHGGIDGFSRLVLYLSCSNNNKSLTVLEKFVVACKQYGVPGKVRCDHGREHIDIGMFMNIVNGLYANSFLTGRSVHNQRIERLWRDVFEQVIDLFYQLFYSMEDEGELDINSPTHMYALQFCFLPIINDHLEEFRQGWNKHKMRTMHNKSPQQAWIDGVFTNLNSSSLTISNIFCPTPIQVSLQDSLQELGVDIDVSSYEVAGSVFSEDQNQILQDAVNTEDDYRQKFILCKNILGRLSNVQLHAVTNEDIRPDSVI